MTKRNTFSKRVQYNGIIFDSILEAKFAMLIEDTCEYYYHPVTIWYDKKDDTRLGKQGCSDQYKPDFLVRRLSDNKCFLIEIKSNVDRHHIDTLTKEDRAKKYIIKNEHNWEYKVITEKDFELPPSKLDKLNEVKKTRAIVARKNKSSRKHFKFSNHKVNYKSIKMPMNRHYTQLNESDYLHFVKTGIVRDTAPE